VVGFLPAFIAIMATAKPEGDNAEPDATRDRPRLGGETARAEPPAPGSGELREPTQDPAGEDAAASESERHPEPDVLLDVPSVRVREIDLKVTELHAHVALHAALTDLVTIEAGVDVSIGDVDLQLKDVEAQAILKVRLQEVYRIFDRALASVDRNPALLSLRKGETPHRLEEGGVRPALMGGAEKAAEHRGAAVAQDRPVESEQASGVEVEKTPKAVSHVERSRPASRSPSMARRRERRSLAARALSRVAGASREMLRRARDRAASRRQGDGK
jgi:hypothetical protein